jgi:hypothetical protein
MLLPLIECVPAPCQGAIVAEANPSNRIAVDVLNRINDPELMAACVQEKRIAGQYGVGCLQKFGVTSIRYGNRKTVYAAGKDSEGNNFSNWIGLPEIKPLQKKLFSTSDYMGKFFGYDYVTVPVTISEDVVYVANYKAISHGDIAEQLKNKQVWAAGTKTWLELARKGIWVQGSADAFGLEFLQPAWQMPLINMGKKDVAVITHRQSAGAWSSKGWKTYGTYSIAGKKQPGLEEKLKEADMIFWTSFHQFLQYRGSIRASVVHACPYGETAEQLRTAGIDPIVFPGIKAFQQWKQTSGL